MLSDNFSNCRYIGVPNANFSGSEYRKLVLELRVGDIFRILLNLNNVPNGHEKILYGEKQTADHPVGSR